MHQEMDLAKTAVMLAVWGGKCLSITGGFRGERTTPPPPPPALLKIQL